MRVNRAVGKTLSFGFQQVLNKYLKRHLEVFELLLYWFAAEIHGTIILAAGVCESERGCQV